MMCFWELTAFLPIAAAAASRNRGGMNWSTFCNTYQLINDNHELLYTELVNIAEEKKASSGYLGIRAYDPENGLERNMNYYTCSITSYPSVNSQSLTAQIKLGSKVTVNSRLVYSVPCGAIVTIYKDWATFQSINDTKDYEPHGTE